MGRQKRTKRPTAAAPPPSAGRARGPRERGGRRAHPIALRLKAVERVLAGDSVSSVSKLFGPRPVTIESWVEAYRKDGVEGLVPKPLTPPQPRRTRTTEARTRGEAVTTQKQSNPAWGTRRIRDVLARFEGIGVSENEVRRILHESGLIEDRVGRVARERLPRRFERAAPNQLWQSDLFTFLLRRHERLYLVAFMDDHSRFVVSHALAHHQKSELVMEALERGVAAFGAPTEILTDQGRQYTAWRGETEFERELRRNGIRHVKSRAQHPCAHRAFVIAGIAAS